MQMQAMKHHIFYIFCLIYIYIYIYIIYIYCTNIYIYIFVSDKWGEECVGVWKGALGLMSIPEAWPQLKLQFIYI